MPYVCESQGHERREWRFETSFGSLDPLQALCLLSVLFLALVFILVGLYQVWRDGEVSREMARRTRRARLGASKRAMKALSILDQGEHEELDSLIVQCGSIKAAVALSRACRLALKFPRHTPANKLIVLDWLNRNAPEHMSYTQRSRIFPLAAVLTFVKDQRELEAEAVAERFGLSLDAY